MFIGRDDELKVVAEHLGRHRQVTILGPGGVGKTSLARALTADKEHLFIELSAVTDSARVAESVAARFGFTDVDDLVDLLAENPQIVVLDTCEHVLDGAAELAQTIADGAPSVTILATSRIPLDLSEEFVFVLRPLALPQAGSLASSAVDLFLQRACAAGADAAATSDPEAVARLCVRLDGMPLAIELAAARARSMTPNEMLEHLDVSVDVLSRRTRRGESRHRSLRAAIDWSYNLLDAAEQRVLRSLSIFPNSFSLDLAHMVCAAEGITRLNTADVLTSLVDHSLLTAIVSSGETRFRLLDTTKAYAAEQVVQAGERHALRNRYIEQVCQLAAGFLSFGDDWGNDFLTGLVDLAADLLAATKMALDDDTPDRCYMFMLVMWGVVHQVRCAEIASLGKRVLARWSDETYRLWPDAASTTALALRESGKHRESLALAKRALAQVENGMFAPVTIHRLLALQLRVEQPEQALQHAEEGIEAATRLGLAPFIRELRIVRAQLLGNLNRVDEGLALTKAITHETQTTDINHCWALVVQGMLQLMDDAATAEASLQIAHRRSVEANYLFGIGSSLRLLAICSMSLAEHRVAADYVLRAIEHNQRTANYGEQGIALLTAVAVLKAAGHPDAEQVAAGSQGANARPVLGTRQLDEWLIPKAHSGPTMPTNAALRIARCALTEVKANGVAKEPRAVAPREPIPEMSGAVLRRSGDNWTASYGGRTTSQRHTKGIVDIARLLRVPGQEIHVLDLVGAGVVESAADDTIDKIAMAQYRTRIDDLRRELDNATDHADLGRAERARQELDALIEQLSAASGLGSRVRRTTGTADRARSTVTKRVRGTIKKLLKSHPELGRHLDRAISTGAYCKYHPEQTIDWQL